MRRRPAPPDPSPPAAPPGPPGHELPPYRPSVVAGIGLRDSGDPPGGGADPPLVLLHGFTSTADLTWFSVMGALAARGRVLALDLPAHGSSAPVAPPTLEAVADVVAEVIAGEVTGPAIIAGFSMGGVVAQLLWRRHPGAVAGLVLCSTAADFRPAARRRALLDEPAHRAAVATGRRLPERLRAPLTDRLRATTARRLGGATATDPLQVWAQGEVRRGDPWGVAALGGALRRFDGSSWAPTVDVPCAVVVTTQDQVVPVDRQRRLAAAVRAVHVAEVEGDHDRFIDRPQPWATAVLDASEAVREALAAA